MAWLNPSVCNNILWSSQPHHPSWLSSVNTSWSIDALHDTQALYVISFSVRRCLAEGYKTAQCRTASLCSLWRRKPVSQITYTVLVKTLNPAQSNPNLFGRKPVILSALTVLIVMIMMIILVFFLFSRFCFSVLFRSVICICHSLLVNYLEKSSLKSYLFTCKILFPACWRILMFALCLSINNDLLLCYRWWYVYY